ncbi:toxin [Actinocatenispora comari]|uniref:Toxin n=2 Tax=Actinocatenispora comari TaxID=2807577 RepID=A0A8J4EPU4_9ACTN|nr:toxin [Actinocatenispora comari]
MHIVDASALQVHWRRSSRSNNGGNCVEVAELLPDARWRRSSRSGNGGQCVEVAANLAATRGIVAVRDSKDPAGPALTVTPQAWTGFLASITAGADGTP